MGTANTMCAMAEVLGFSPHGNASCRSQTPRWHELARTAARQVMQAWKDNVRPSDILGQESFENVVRYMMATGGAPTACCTFPPWPGRWTATSPRRPSTRSAGRCL